LEVKKATHQWSKAEDNSGYVVLGKEALDDDQVSGDPKESYDMNHNHLLSSIWNTTSAVPYWNSLRLLSLEILRAYAEVLRLDDVEFFTKSHSEAWNTLRLLHYPPTKEVLRSEDMGMMRAGAHSDYGTFTILIQDDIGGLEVFDRFLQNWVPVPPKPNTVLVNTADLLMRWSNDRMVSTLHRVAPAKGADSMRSRYSIPYFVNPNAGHVVDSKDILPDEPRVYEPIGAKQYLVQRLSSTYSEEGLAILESETMKTPNEHVEL